MAGIGVRLLRVPGTTRFQRHRRYSVAATLTSLDPESKFKVSLSPEDWRLLGCPDAINVAVSGAAPEDAITADGAWCSPIGDP